MYSYTAYNLAIASDLELPELVPSSGPCDVRITIGRLAPPSLTSDEARCASAQTPEGAWLSWDDVGVFLVREGRAITVDPAPGVDEAVLRLFVLGPALGTLLHQRGLFVLHASSVAIGDGVVAFIGEKGWGKSTTAGLLQARGHRLMADDILALKIADDGTPLVLPGFPQLKLWPDAVAALGDDPEALPRLRPELDKRSRHVAAGFSHEPLPLRRLYVLGGGPELAIAPLTLQQAFFEVTRHSYAPRFLGKHGTGAAHFRNTSALVQRVPVNVLLRPRDLDALPELARMIEDHAAEPAHA